jgi:hypothetical protein
MLHVFTLAFDPTHMCVFAVRTHEAQIIGAQWAWGLRRMMVNRIIAGVCARMSTPPAACVYNQYLNNVLIALFYTTSSFTRTLKCMWVKCIIKQGREYATFTLSS